MMKQIILITDGCSNVGVNPVIAAAEAKEQGVAVNVIGIVDNGAMDERGVSEIQEIASAGGGMSRVVTTSALSQTMQMMTRKTIAHTIQQAVGKELRSILGTSELESLPPAKRAQVVQVIDDMSETAALKLALLVDTSASMKPKLAAVKDAVSDLQLSLHAREGDSLMSVFHFPGNGSPEQAAGQLMNWTDNLANLNRLFYKINMRGATPTGPALLYVLSCMHEIPSGAALDDHPADGRWTLQEGNNGHDRDGMLSDYVV